MLPFELMFLPKVSIKKRDTLPHKPGIYYGVDSYGEVRYVGMAKNLHTRWNADGNREHHKLNSLISIGASLRYRIVPEYRLRYEEALDIQYFKPDLNRQFPDPNDHRSLRIQVEQLVGNLSGLVVSAIISLLILQMSGVPIIGELQKTVETNRIQISK